MEDIEIEPVQLPPSVETSTADSPTSQPCPLDSMSHIYQPYKGVKAKLSVASSHDETTDVRTTFIGLVMEPNSTKSYTPEYSFPFDACSCTQASLF